MYQHFIIGGTVYGIQKAFRDNPTQMPFDVAIIDEGSQLRVADSLLAISRVHPNGRIIIAGDHRQLPPIVKGAYPTPDNEDMILHRSIFELLQNADQSKNQITRQITDNFRMNELLCRYPADALYGPDYRSADDKIAKRRLSLSKGKSFPEDEFAEWILDANYPLVVCVMDGVRTAAENKAEAELVARLSYQLRTRLISSQSGKVFSDDMPGDIDFWRRGLFVVSPHHVQIRAIRQALKAKGLRPPFFVDTVDKMQGQECDAVIVSYGVADPEAAMNEGEFIYSLNRLNVSITRARCKTVVLLSKQLLTPTLRTLEETETSAGIAFMLGLEKFAQTNGEKVEFAENAVRTTVFRVHD